MKRAALSLEAGIPSEIPWPPRRPGRLSFAPTRARLVGKVIILALVHAAGS